MRRRSARGKIGSGFPQWDIGEFAKGGAGLAGTRGGRTGRRRPGPESAPDVWTPHCVT